MNVWIPIFTSFIVVISLSVFAFLLFRFLWNSNTKIRNTTRNLSLSLFSTLYFLLIIEIAFRVFFIQSDGYCFTLASKRWFQKHWNPINDYGYRDYEHDWKENVLFVVGDSFVAGHGIKHIDDRLSGVLADKLGSKWTVAVLANPGWTTMDEYNALTQHPKRPQKIIFSYFINDIESAANANGVHRPEIIKWPHPMIRPLVDNSFVVNYFYWRLYRKLAVNNYSQYIEHAFNDPGIWGTHKQELDKIIDFAHQIGSDIAFIVWPNLNNVDASSQFTSKVTDFLVQQNVQAIDLTRHFSGRPPNTLVVNSLDGHPNINTNREVADLLYQLLFMEAGLQTYNDNLIGQ